MKRLFCIAQVLVLLVCAAALGEGSPVDRQDGQVRYLLPESVAAPANVTPFTAQPYRFSDSEQIARLFFGDVGYSLEGETVENRVYVCDGASLMVSKPDMDGRIYFNSEYAQAVFTPIPLKTDVYAMGAELTDPDQELSFMCREEAEGEAERLAGAIFDGAGFRSIASFAITRSDYEARYAARSDELEAYFADPKMSEGMQPWTEFPQEDLGYLICLAQEVNALPVAWSFFQNVPSAPYSLPVQLWVFWTPEGCKYFSCDLPVMRPQKNGAACEVLSREQAMQIFSQAYNGLPDAKAIEVSDMELAWFTDMPDYDETGNIAGDALTFRPMWCLHVPRLFDESAEGWDDCGYYIDAVTGETWV